MITITTVRKTAGKILLPQEAHWWLFLVYIAVLPIAETIALRNLLLAALAVQGLAYVLVAGVARASDVPSRIIPPLLYPWITYLLIFPVLAGDPVVARRELGGQWIECIIAWLISMLTLVRCGAALERVWSIALACAVYPILYLAMFFWAWLGGFGNPPAIGDMAPLQVLLTAIAGGGNLHWPIWSDIPWGFRGFDPIHANLGVACVHTAVALLAYGIQRWGTGLGMRTLPYSLLGAVALLPPFLANSRASILFMGLLALTALVMVWLAIPRNGQQAVAFPRRGRSWQVGIGLTLLVLTALAALALKVYKEDARWQAIYRKATIGFVIPDPVGVVCSGYTAELEEGLRRRLDDLPAESVDQTLSQVKSSIEAVAQWVDGDLGRVLMARSGWQLVLEHPFGLDGSRNSYKRLIREKCGHAPYIEYAHSHQGWIDLALALGWVGAALYLTLLLYLIGLACLRMTDSRVFGWPLGLAMLCIFWILRGLVDSVYREHYLQMQAVMIAVFWVATRMGAREKKEGRSAQDKVL